MKVGEEMDVMVSEVSRRGEGVARIQGFVIFIPNTKQGTQAKIRIKEITAQLRDCRAYRGWDPELGHAHYARHQSNPRKSAFRDSTLTIAIMNCFLTVVASLPDLTIPVAVTWDSSFSTWTR